MLQMECVLRPCFVKNPRGYAKANYEGDDVFLCEYEYDIHWHSFKRLAEIDDDEEVRTSKQEARWVYRISGVKFISHVKIYGSRVLG